MLLSYSYPGARLLIRIKLLFPGYDPNRLMDITSMIDDLHVAHGDQALDRLRDAFASSSYSIPVEVKSLSDWKTWVATVLVPSESPLLSPGSMSNAPDRFDGFHSFNICCRGGADTGRRPENMKSYGTDRRVFEYWSDGNWVASNHMMGVISTALSAEACQDGGPGAPTPDHIGPLSLGFCHIPIFRLLSKSANSAKNNRMSLWDVRWLIAAENAGHRIISWHSEDLWDARKLSVSSDEEALRLSKALRDNHRNAMHMLSQFYSEGCFSFLTSLMHLEHAQFDYQFDGLSVCEFVTIWKGIKSTGRRGRLVAKQMARRIRVGFESLAGYALRENRHRSDLWDASCDAFISDAVKHLRSSVDLRAADLLISKCFQDTSTTEEALRVAAPSLLALKELPEVGLAKAAAKKAMGRIAGKISSLWGDDRYVRALSLD